MNDDKKDSLIFTAITIFIVWLIIFFSIICTGCTGTRFYIDDENGRSAIRTITRLEEQLSQLDRRVEIITTGSENLETDIDKFTAEFRIYVDTVRAMRTELEEYRNRTKTDEN